MRRGFCPAGYVPEYDSGNQPTPQTATDAATVSGTFVGYDSTATSSMSLHGEAAFGTLKGLVTAHSGSTGAYVDADGLVSGTTGEAFTDVSFADVLAAHSSPPGGSVALALSYLIGNADSTSVVGDAPTIDPCLANGFARTQLNANFQVTPSAGSGGGLVQYGRRTHSCSGVQITGGPFVSVPVTVPDGATVNVSLGMTVDAYARADGGLGGAAHPNRVRSADATLDASNTAKVYVEVLTAGASYVSASGAIYEVPEAEASTATAAALASLLAARRRRG